MDRFALAEPQCIGTQASVNDAVNWSSKLSFVIGTDMKVDTIQKGRFLSVRVEASGQSAFRAESFEVEVERAERY